MAKKKTTAKVTKKKPPVDPNYDPDATKREAVKTLKAKMKGLDKKSNAYKRMAKRKKDLESDLK